MAAALRAASASKEDDSTGAGGEEKGLAIPAVPAWLLSSSVDLPATPPAAPSYLGRRASALSASAAAAAAGPPAFPTSATGSLTGPASADALAVAAGPVPAPQAATAAGEHAQRVVNGFRLVEMSMRDGDSGRVVWASRPGAALFGGGELEARLPAALLRASSVTRALTFSSVEAISDLRMAQRVHLHGAVVEEAQFRFGFVIPGSTNSWEQEQEVDADNALPAEALSGQLLVETLFYDGGEHLATAVLRIFYDSDPADDV